MDISDTDTISRLCADHPYINEGQIRELLKRCIAANPGHHAAHLEADVVRGVRKGIADERARLKQILKSPHAPGREALAQHLAFRTDTPAAEVEALLQVAPATRASTALDRYIDLAAASQPAASASPQPSIDAAGIYANRRREGQG